MTAKTLANNTQEAKPVLCHQTRALIKQSLIKIATSIPDQERYTADTLLSLLYKNNDALRESGLGDAVVAELLPTLLTNSQKIQEAWSMVKTVHFNIACDTQDPDGDDVMSDTAFGKLNLQELLNDVMYKTVTNHIESLAWRAREKYSTLPEFVAAIEAL